MLSTIWLRGIILASVISIITSLGYLGYSKIKQIGYDEASAKYEKVINTHIAETNTKIRSIEVSANTLVELQKSGVIVLRKDITSITNGLKGKTLTVIKNGECIPSEIFTDSFIEINRRVNESMK